MACRKAIGDVPSVMYPTVAECLAHEWFQCRYQDEESVEINVKNLKFFLSRRKLQHFLSCHGSVIVLQAIAELLEASPQEISLAVPQDHSSASPNSGSSSVYNDAWNQAQQHRIKAGADAMKNHKAVISPKKSDMSSKLSVCKLQLPEMTDLRHVSPAQSREQMTLEMWDNSTSLFLSEAGGSTGEEDCSSRGSLNSAFYSFPQELSFMFLMLNEKENSKAYEEGHNYHRSSLSSTLKEPILEYVEDSAGTEMSRSQICSSKFMAESCSFDTGTGRLGSHRSKMKKQQQQWRSRHLDEHMKIPPNSSELRDEGTDAFTINEVFIDNDEKKGFDEDEECLTTSQFSMGESFILDLGSEEAKAGTEQPEVVCFSYAKSSLTDSEDECLENSLLESSSGKTSVYSILQGSEEVEAEQDPEMDPLLEEVQMSEYEELAGADKSEKIPQKNNNVTVNSATLKVLRGHGIKVRDVFQQHDSSTALEARPPLGQSGTSALKQFSCKQSWTGQTLSSTDKGKRLTEGTFHSLQQQQKSQDLSIPKKLKASISLFSKVLEARKLKINDQIRMAVTEQEFLSLTIFSVKQEDLGNYQCVAINAVGQASTSCNLILSELPICPASPEVNQAEEDKVLLMWEPVPSTIPLVYCIEYSRDGGGWRLLVEDVTDTSYMVSSLPRGAVYIFRIACINREGMGPFSEPSAPVTIGGTPEDFDIPVIHTESPVRAISGSAEHAAHPTYSFLSEINRGRFSVVTQCREDLSKQLFAAKITPYKQEQQQLVLREYQLLKRLNHTHLVRLHAAFLTPRYLVLIEELCAGHELLYNLAERGLYAEMHVSELLQQILSAVDYLHKNNIVHLDLKSDNMLVTDHNLLKVVDLGSAQTFSPGQTLSVEHVWESKESKVYIVLPKAPEILGGHGVGPATDIWAIGFLTFIMLSAENPFQSNLLWECERNIRKGRIQFGKCYPGLSEGSVNFMKRTLSNRPWERPTAAECLQIPWIQSMCQSSRHCESTVCFSTDKLRTYLREREIKREQVRTKVEMEGHSTTVVQGQKRDVAEWNGCQVPKVRGPPAAQRRLSEERVVGVWSSRVTPRFLADLEGVTTEPSMVIGVSIVGELLAGKKSSPD
ncbi:obscurin-like [Megalops cyprinoides]|uniref:obscurin-like n=1 Tax=Megalops cyprinoides TaxID=118141 RepID=UPI001864C6DD|nr:obscurin-like [Megalops cyprinoides]